MTFTQDMIDFAYRTLAQAGRATGAAGWQK
jgi:hypothetical protein